MMTMKHPRPTSPILGVVALAVAALGCATTPDPPMPSEGTLVRMDLIAVLVDSGNYDAAVPLLQRALAAHPEEGMLHYYQGVVLGSRGYRALAERELRKALELRPGLAHAMDRLGRVLARSGSPKDAVLWHQKAVKAQPRNPAFHNNLGWSLFVAGRPAEAVKAFEEAVSLDPRSRKTQTNLGFAYARVGRTDDARRAFEQAGTPASAAANLGAALALLGRRTDARVAYEAALRHDPTLHTAREALEELKTP